MGVQTTALGELRVPIPLSYQGASLCELTLPLPSPITSKFVDSALIEVQARIRVLALVIDTALTSSGAQQANVQLFASRSQYSSINPASGAFAGGQGATSQFPATGPNAAQAVGPAVPFGPSSAALGGSGAVFFFTPTYPGNPSASPPTSMTELCQPWPCIGIEISAAAAFTGGVIRAFVILAPI